MSIPYRIIVDAAGDFFHGDLEKYDIPVIPMEVSVGEVSFTYSPETSEEDKIKYYDELKKGALPTTSQVTAYQYVKFFTPYLEKGEDILYLALDSEISGMYNQALLAARELKETFPERQIEVVDTLSATAGIGVALRFALKNRDNGMSLKENADDLKEIRQYFGHLFVVEDLFHLKRGGRISTVTATVSTALNIKPILHIDEEGHLVPILKARGMKQAIKEICKMFKKYRDKNYPQQVIISHGNSLKNAKYMESLVKEELGVDEVEIGMMNPVVGTHTGAGIVALIFRGKR